MVQTPYEEALGVEFEFRRRFEDLFRKPGFAKPYIHATLERVGESPGVRRFPVLGEGSAASVYWLKDRTRILKLTQDYTDACASEIVRKKPDRSLIKVYDVFEIVPKKLWGIVSEKLQPLSPTEDSVWDFAITAILYNPPGIQDITPAWVDKLEDILAQPHEEPLASEYARVTPRMVEYLRVWAEALTARGILWGDLIPDNIMYRGRTLLISDLGGSKVRRVHIPKLKVS